LTKFSTTVLQVDELRDAGASELQRRRSLEATLKQAAGLFRKELAHKSDEVAALQVCALEICGALFQETSGLFQACLIQRSGCG
jgi:hypothetical protein